ncbi:MAG: VCBS repeat-containing protein [Chitinispirillaceae bacterium]|nr:VCBS repeat-containing protein [Chitinispirillaceae bacterium]
MLNSGNAAPFVVYDWNRDGLFDIVTGEENGCLSVFLNTGTGQVPLFGPAKSIRGTEGSICIGSKAAPFVVDWNNDGLKDLIIGSEDGFVTLFIAVPNVPPVADAGPNIIIPSSEIPSTVIIGSVSDDNEDDELSYRWLKGDNVLSDWAPATAEKQCLLALAAIEFNVGTHVLTLETSDGLATGSDDMFLTIENSIPSVVATGAGIYEISSDVVIGGTVADYDGDPIHFQWFNGDILLFEGDVQPETGGVPFDLPDYIINSLSLGTHTLTLSVTDHINEFVSSDIDVTIVDTTVPTLAPSSSVNMLWPPNHTMRTVSIAANAEDNAGSVTLSTVISSNEPQNGLGDGDEAPDWTEPVINQESGIITFSLRAERSGNGNGRIYTIRITATDNSGNISSVDVKILVPHNK